MLWAILGDKPGDNSQVLSLARAVGAPFATKHLRYNKLYKIPNWIDRSSLKSLQKNASDPLVPPWPDAIIAIGRRSVPVVRWVQRMSGGKTRLIHLGRPRAPLHWFDLVVRTPQYDVSERANVMTMDLPFQEPDREALAAAATRWEPVLTADGTERIALLVGGNSPPFRFDAVSVHALAEGTRTLSDARSARVFATCGRRLPAPATTSLREALGDACVHFHTMAEPPDQNPYRGYLALADRFIVSADSVSMMADAVATGRPVHLFCPSCHWPLWRRLARTPLACVEALLPARWRDGLVARGLWMPRRQNQRISTALVAAGRACWLTPPPREAGGARPVSTVPRGEVVARVRAVLNAPSSAAQRT